MKLSKRERMALLVLLFVGILYLLVTFLFRPMLADRAELQTQVEELRTMEMQVKEKLEGTSLAELQQERDGLYGTATQRVSTFLPPTTDAQMFQFIADVARAQGVNPTSVGVSDSALQTTTLPVETLAEMPSYELGLFLDSMSSDIRKGDKIGEEATAEEPAPPETTATDDAAAVDETADGAATDPETATDGTEEQPGLYAYVASLDVTLDDVSYGEVLRMLQGVENVQRTIVLNRLNLEKGEDSNLLTASMNYSFIAIDKLDESDPGIATPTIPGASNRRDPFS